MLQVNVHTLNTSKWHASLSLEAKLSPNTMMLLQGLLLTSQRPLLARLATLGPEVTSTLQSGPSQPSAHRHTPGDRRNMRPKICSIYNLQLLDKTQVRQRKQWRNNHIRPSLARAGSIRTQWLAPNRARRKGPGACCALLTFATLAMTAAIINTEKIHNGPGRKEAGGGGGGRVPGPEAGVGVDGESALLLDPVQVEPGISCVPRVLENKYWYRVNLNRST